MYYTIELVAHGVLRAELFGRKTAAETQEFIAALVAEVEKSDATRIFVLVRASRPIFRVEQYGLSEHFKRLAGMPQARMALLADSDEVRSSHEYVETLARQQNLSVRSFRSEALALEWLQAEAAPPLAERRQSQEKR